MHARIDQLISAPGLRRFIYQKVAGSPGRAAITNGPNDFSRRTETAASYSAGVPTSRRYRVYSQSRCFGYTISGDVREPFSFALFHISVQKDRTRLQKLKRSRRQEISVSRVTTFNSTIPRISSLGLFLSLRMILA